MVWNPFRRRQTLVVTPSGGLLDKVALETGGRWRKGMWVDVGGRIGVLTALVEGRATVMLTDHEEGTNVLQIECGVGELAQAKRSQIPPKRRLHLTEGDLERLGYPG